MIDEAQLMEWRPHFMDDRQLEKHYLQTLLLFELYSDFGNELVFKGGTSLSMFYGLDRFSEDLDFTYEKEATRADTVARFERCFNRLNEMYEIVKTRRRGTKTSLDLEIKINGPLFRTRKTAQAIEVNVSMREALCAKPEAMRLLPVYQDISAFIVPVMEPSEILAEKIRALMLRKYVKARDIYDIYFLIDSGRAKINGTFVERKLKYYGATFSAAALRERLGTIDSSAWKSELSNILKTVPDFKKIVQSVEHALINGLDHR